MGDARLLSHLQDLDLEIDARTSELGEIEAMLGETDTLQNARSQVDELRALLSDQQTRLRELEWKTESLTAKMTEEEGRLYSGRIHNPKELDTLRRVIEHIRDERQQLDEQSLELMDAIEAIQRQLADAQSALADVGVLWEQEQRTLAERQTAVESRLSEVREARHRVAASTPANEIVLYEELRRDKRGLAVSRIERSTCLGCRIALPLGLVQRVRADRDLIYCPSCGRILHA